MATVFDTLISDAQKAVGQGRDVVRAASGFINDPVGSTFQDAYFWTALTPRVGMNADEVRRLLRGQKATPPVTTEALTEKVAQKVSRAVESSYMRILKPVAQLRSPLFGQLRWAPYGVPDQDQWKKTLTTIGLSTAAFLLGYTVVVYSVGRAKGRKET